MSQVKRRKHPLQARPTQTSIMHIVQQCLIVIPANKAIADNRRENNKSRQEYHTRTYQAVDDRLANFTKGRCSITGRSIPTPAITARRSHQRLLKMLHSFIQLRRSARAFTGVIMLGRQTHS